MLTINRQKIVNEDWWFLLLLWSFVFVLSKFSWAIISGDFKPYIPASDMEQYLLRISEPLTSSGVNAPFKYRLLTPFLVSLLPINPILGFYLLNVSLTCLTTVIYYFYLKNLKFSPGISAIGVTIFIVSHVVLYNFFLPMVDAMTHLIVITGFYMAQKEKYDWIPILTVIGILNHEAILFLILLYFQAKPKTFLTVLISSLPVIELFFIRMGLGFSNMFSVTIIVYLVNNWVTTLLFILQTFLIVWIGLINIPKNAFLKKSRIVLLGIIPLMLLAQHTARMLFLMHPVLIPAYLIFLEPKK